MNLQDKITNLKEVKQGFSFLTSVEDLLKEKYSEIFDDTLDVTMIKEMIDEIKLRFCVINKDYELDVIENKWFIQGIDRKKDNSITALINYDWSYNRILLKDLYVVNDESAYLDYLVKDQEKRVENNIKKFEEIIKKDKEELENYKERIELAKKYNITSNELYKVERYVRAEKILNKTMTVEDLVKEGIV